MKFLKLILGSILLSTVFCTRISAQTNEVGLSLGIANYQGELSSFVNIQSPGPYGSIFYRANLGKAFSFRGSFSLARIQEKDNESDDLFSQQRNHSFETIILELGGQIEYNFLNFREGNRIVYQRWSPYLFLGLAYHEIEPLNNEQPSYSTRGISLPMGVGIKAALTDYVNIGFEFGARFTSNDFLDDLDVNVTNTSTPTPRNPKFFSRNPDDNDMYFFTGVTLSYVFRDLGKDCPVKIY